MKKFYILRDCKRTGIEVRLRPDDAKANAKILESGDKDSLYWVRADGPSEIEELIRTALVMNTGRILIGEA